MNILFENPENLRPVALGLNIARTLKTLYPNDWEPKRYDTLLVHKATFDGLLAGKTAPELEKGWAEDLAKFLKRRQAALLYE